MRLKIKITTIGLIIIMIMFVLINGYVDSVWCSDAQGLGSWLAIIIQVYIYKKSVSYCFLFYSLSGFSKKLKKLMCVQC